MHDNLLMGEGMKKLNKFTLSGTIILLIMSFGVSVGAKEKQGLRNLDKDENGSFYSGNVISINSSKNLIISPNKLTATIGLQNITVINLNEMTLILPTSEAESVKKLVTKIKSLNKDQYL